jgi:hypothetical protein
MTPASRWDEPRWVNTVTGRTGKGVAVALAVVELTALVAIWLSWASSYWSWDPQHYGDPPGSYLEKAALVPAAAAVVAVVAGIRRLRAVAVSQVVLAIAVCGILLGAKAPWEHFYKSSYQNACRAGMICDGTPPAR